MKKVLLVTAAVWGCLTIFSGFVVFNFLGSDAQFYVGLGDFNYELGRTDAAIGMYQRAVRIDNRNAEAHFSLGHAYFFDKAWNEKAIEEFQKAVELKPGDGSYHSRLALAYAKGGNPEGAEKEHAAALSLSPDSAVVHLNYGSFRREFHKDFTRAEEEYRKAIKLDPSFAKAYSSLGRMYSDLGRKEEAKDNLRQAVQLFHKQGNGSLAFKDQQLLQSMEGGETTVPQKD